MSAAQLVNRRHPHLLAFLPFPRAAAGHMEVGCIDGGEDAGCYRVENPGKLAIQQDRPCSNPNSHQSATLA